MATRFYFPDAVDAAVAAPAAAAEWEHVNANARAALALALDASVLATVAYTPDAADDLTDRDALHRQYVSPPLAPQVLGGTVTAQLQCLETFANDNLFLALKVLVCSLDGSTVRATLLALTRATSLELSNSLMNRTFPSTALAGYTCAKGDRLVVEVGLGGNISSGTGGTIGHNGSIRWGCVASSGDLGVDETQVGTTFRPWIEFSQNFVWEWQLPVSPGSFPPKVGSPTCQNCQVGMY